MKDTKKSIWEDLDLFCVCRFVLRHIWMVVLSALIFVMSVFLVQKVAVKPTFTSSVTFTVTSRSTVGASAGNIAVTDTVAAKFGELLSSDILRAAAAESMGLDHFPASVSVNVPENTNVLIMDVEAATPELAYRSATAIMQCHQEYSETIFASAVLDNINGPTVATQP